MAITFKVGFQLDDKDLSQSLSSISKEISNAFNIKGNSLTPEIQKATQQAMVLEKAMKRATTDKGISYYSLQSELRKAGTDAAKLTTTLAAGGEHFQASLNAANSALALSDRRVIALNSKIKEMSRVMVQSFKFTAAQTVIRELSSQLREAVKWTTGLYDSVNEIGIVTGKNAEQLTKVTEQTIQAAKNLRVAAKEYAEGSLIFYQQGLSDDEVMRRTEITVKAAKAANESVDQMSSELTAIWNNYKMIGEEQARAASVGAKMAAQTAVDFSDIAEAMQTAAAPAAQMGVSYDSLAAIIATVGDTTQQSASVIGNAYKTIFSRFQQLKSSGTDGEVTLNRVSQQLKELGVNVLDVSGQLRPLDDVIQEVGNSWESWSTKQQLAIAQLVGGTRQYGQFLALMNNYDKYQKNLEQAQLEDGSTLEAQYGQYLESIESYAENAGEAWNRAFGEIIDPEAIKSVYKATESIGLALESILAALGGAPGILFTVATLLSGKIVPSLIKGAQNAKVFVNNLTPAGRQKNIKDDYAAQGASIDAKLKTASSQAEKDSLTIQKQKLSVNREIALVNEEINNKMRTASAEQTSQLEQEKQKLQIAQQTYQTKLDELMALDKIAQKQSQDMSKKSTNDYQDEVDEARINAIVKKENEEILREKAASATGKEKVALMVELKSATEEAKIAQEAYNKAVQKMNAAPIVELNNALTQAYAELARGGNNFGALEKALKKVGVSGEQVDKALKEFAKGNVGPIKELVEQNTRLKMSLDDVVDAARRADGAYDAFEDSRTASQTSGKVQKEIEDLPSDSLPNKIDYTGIATGMTELTMSAGMLSMALTSLWDVMSSEDLSFGQKMFSLLPIVGQLVFGIQGLVKAGQSLSAIAKAASIDSARVTAARTAEAKATEALALAEEHLAKVKGKSNKKRGKGELQNAHKDVIQAKKNLAEATAEREAAEAGSVKGGLKNIGSDILTKLKAIPPQAAIAAAAIAAIVLLYNEWQKTTVEAKAEALGKAVTNLKQQTDQAKQSADNLRTSIDKYSNSKKTLDSCVKGTEEWEKALKETNSAALELMKSLDMTALSAEEIQNLFKYDEDGVLQINQESLDKMQAEADKKANRLDYASMIASAELNYTKSQIANKADIRQQNGLSWGGIRAGIASGAAIGAGLGTVVPGAGNAIGAASGALIAGGAAIGGYFGEKWAGDAKAEAQMEKIYENISELQNKTGKELEEGLKKLGFNVDSTSEEFKVYEKIVAEAAAATEAYEAQVSAATRAAVEAELDGKYSSQARDIAAQNVEQKKDEITEDLNKWINDNFNKADWLNTSGAAEALLARYNKAAGTSYTKDSNFSRGTDNDRTFAFKDEQGQLVELTKEQVVATIAASEAMEELTGSAENAAKALGMIQASERDDFNNFITNKNFNSMTQGEIASNFLGEDNKVSEDKAKAYLEEVFGGEEQLKQAAELMNTTVDQLVQQVIDGATISSQALDELQKTMSATSKRIFNDIQDSGKLNNLSVETQQMVGQLIQNAFESTGKEGAEKFSTFITDTMEGMDEKQATKFVSALKDIDWTTVTPDGMRQQLEKAGVVMDNFTNEALQDLIDSMINLYNVTQETAQANYKKYNDIGKDLEAGSVLSDTDYNTLTDNGTNGMAQYFTMMRDGTYQLTGDAKAFYEELRKQSELSYNYLAQKNNMQEARLNKASEYINNSTIDDANIGVSGLGKVEGAEIRDTQLAYLNSQNNLTPEDLALLTEWNNQLTYSADDYDKIAEMANKYNISVNGVKDAQEKLNEEMKEAQEIANATRISEDMSQSGTSWEELEANRAVIKDMIKNQKDAEESADSYSKALLENEQALNEVAKEQTRFNNGLVSAGEGLETWKEAIGKDGVKDAQKFAESLEDMRGAYADLLDVDGTSLSEEFLASGENLELLETILTGTADEAAAALAELQKNAIIDLQLDMNEEDLLNNITTIQSALDGLAAGTEITPTVDNQAFFDALNAMIMACGTDMAKIEALCNNLNIEPLTAEDLIPAEGIGADVETDTTTVEAEGKNEATSYEAVPGEPLTLNATVTDGPSDIDVGGGNIATISVPTWDYQPKKEAETTEQQVPVTSFKLKPGTGVTKTSSNRQRVNNASPVTPDTYRGGATKPKNSGGGGSKPKHQAIKAKKYESMKKEDRYSTIKASIEEVQRSLDKYNDAVDDSWGSAKIRALQQANRELERQAKDYQALYKSAKSYLSIDQKEAAKNKKDLGKKLGLNLIDPTFNKDGFLSNKTEVINQLDDYLQALYQKYYDAAQKYDADKSTDEKRKERIDQMLEEYNVAKEAVDEYISSLDQVDETANEAHEALMKLVEGIRQEIAYRVEEITYKMEFRIKINDRDIEWFEHIIDKMGDVGLITGKSFEQIIKSFNSSASSVQTAADTFEDLQDLLASLNTKEGQKDFIAKFGQEAWDYYLATGKLSAEVIEGMSDVYDQAFDALKQAYDDFDAMFEQYLSLLDIYLSEFDRFSNQISRQSDQLEAYRQLLDFSGKGYGEDGRAARKSLSDAQISNAKTELARAQSVAKMLEGSVKDSEERLQEFYDTYGKDPSGWDTATAHAFNQIKQTHDEIVSQYEDAQSDITAALTDVIDAATEALEDGHERITEAFVEGFNGLFTSLDSALTQYEWKTDIRDFYLDDYDKNYELDKLLGEIDDAMTDVTDPERLQAWGALQDEINAKMAEGVKITQTDLDILRAQFELEQAKDQYEEAKNAKNTMRLARDASGNWNYVYSSESSEAEDAEQKMKDAMANIHKMHREAADSMSDLWYQTYIEMEKYEYEVDQLRYKNNEQYRAEVNEFRRLYKEKLDFYESEVIKHNGAIDRSFADTVLGQQTGYDTMEEAADAYYQANEQYTKELQDNANEYEETIRETCDMVGISYEQLEQWIRDRANNIMQSNDDMAEKMEETSIRGSAALGNLSDNIDTYAWSMIESLRALELQVESLYNTLQTLSDWEANVGMNADFGTDYTDYIGTDFYNKYGKDATANDVKDYMSSAEVQQLIKERLYVMQNDPNRGEWYDPETAYEDVYNEVYNSLMAILKDIQNDKGYWTDDNWDFGENGSAKKKRTASGGLIKTPQVRSLAEEGPELVLNKDDTQNILEAVKNMRETIKLKISAMNSSIGQKVQGETIATQPNVETIEQNVKIDATFPGVSVASEIEEALNNLINQAVQYAHKNNR